jgi:hypothetical protein
LRNGSGAGAPPCDPQQGRNRTGPPRPPSTHERIPLSVAHGWCLANYVRNLRPSEFMNFQSPRTCLVLAPCHLG